MLADMIVRFDPISDIRAAARAILGALFFILGTALVGFASGRALHKICHKDAALNMALVTCLLLILQPVAYGWLVMIIRLAG
jgi:hypothetical protein